MNPRRSAKHRSMQMATGIALIFAVMLGAGCNSKSDVDIATDPDMEAELDQNVSVSAPQPTGQGEAQTLNVSPGASTDAVLKSLNRELARWLMKNRRTPASFEEFVSSAQIHVPPAPAGKKYDLSKDTRIVLVKR